MALGWTFGRSSSSGGVRFCARVADGLARLASMARALRHDFLSRPASDALPLRSVVATRSRRAGRPVTS